MSQLTRNILEIARCGNQFSADTMCAMGLKTCHASYLLEICNHPGISQDQLANRICINKSNIARQAAALEEGGFITRRTSPEDKRVMQLYPTEKTLELLPQIRESLRGWEDYLTHGFTEEEVALLEGLLERAHQRAALWVEAR